MKPFQANLINGVILMVLGAWAYLSAGDEASPTALIPAAFGLIFLISTPLFKKGNKVVVHVVVLLTLVVLIALGKPLMSQISKGDTMGIMRVATMMFSSLVALVVFIKSFIDARKARNAEA